MKKKAFTLIELSIFIVLFSVIIAAMLQHKTAELFYTKQQISHQRIQTVYQALGRYLILHKKLPCPAPITAIKSTDSLYGTASTVDGNCAYSTDGSTDGVYQSTSTGAQNLVYGMIPVATLGLSEIYAEDGFGNKFDYIIDKNFTSATSFGTAYTSNTSDLTNSISTNFSVVTYVDITQENNINSKAIFAIISHGVDSLGAFSANSATISATPDTTPEINNSATAHDDTPNTNTAEFSNVKYNMDSTAITEISGRKFYTAINDIVFAKTRDDLVKEFNAYNTIPCQDDGKNSLLVYDATTMLWPDETTYNNDAVSLTQCPSGYDEGAQYPTKRCGPFGVWQDMAVIECETP